MPEITPTPVPVTTTPAATAPSWADVKDHAGLSAISISIHAFGALTSRPWVKASLAPAHWDRIVSIAETAPEELHDHPGRGFSWVSMAVIDGAIIRLDPPAHLSDDVAADKL